MTSMLQMKQQLSREKCWKYWMTPGNSLKNVCDLLEADGLLNQKTGRKFTSAAVERAAYQWVLDINNRDSARKEFEYRMQSMGRIVSEEDWKIFLLEACSLVYHNRPKHIKQFIAQNGLQSYVTRCFSDNLEKQRRFIERNGLQSYT